MFEFFGLIAVSSSESPAFEHCKIWCHKHYAGSQVSGLLVKKRRENKQSDRRTFIHMNPLSGSPGSAPGAEHVTVL